MRGCLQTVSEISMDMPACDTQLLRGCGFFQWMGLDCGAGDEEHGSWEIEW